MPTVSSQIQNLHAYTPGLQPQEVGWVKLNTNENPYPPSPRVREAILAELGADGAALRLYPEPVSRKLRAKVAELHDLTPDQVFFGNGSDEVLKYLIWAYTDCERKAAMLDPSYSLYPVLTAIKGSEILQIPLDNSMVLPIDAIAASGANLILITHPNAPTGVAFSLDALREVAGKTNALIVIDEAYSAFAENTALPLLREFDHICITRTFSKSHSLAGLRIGYLMGSAETVAILDRVRDAYNLDRLAQVAALAALEDAAYYAKTIACICETRDAFSRELDALGWTVFPSQANFLFVEPRTRSGVCGLETAQALYDFLLSQKILVRYFPKHPFTCSFLRVSIGLPEEMKILGEAIQSWIQQNA